MRSIRYQVGMSTVGILLTLLIGGFFVMAAVKLAPAYLDNILVRENLVQLGDLTDLQEMSKGEIKVKLLKDFNMDAVQGAPTKNIKIIRTKEGWLINVDYEQRIHFFANIDLVVFFTNQLNSAKPDECCEKIIPDVKK